MTQDTLSTLCGMEKANLSRMENGHTNITAETLLKIAEALQVSIIEILGGVEHSEETVRNN